MWVVYEQSGTSLRTAVFHNGTAIDDDDSFQDFSKESHFGQMHFPWLTIPVFEPNYSG